MALWFVSLLVTATLAGVMPGAGAAHSSRLDANIMIKRGAGDFVTYSGVAHGDIRPGDEVMLFWNVTWSKATCLDSPVNPLASGNPSQWGLVPGSASVNATVLGSSFTTPVSTNNETVASADHFRFAMWTTNPIAVTTAPAANQSYAAGSAALRMNFTLRCHNNIQTNPSTAVEERNGADTPLFQLDTQPPSVTITRAVDNTAAPLAPAGVGAIGSRLTYTITPSAGTSTIEWDVSSLLDEPQTFRSITAGSRTITIVEGGTATAPADGFPAGSTMRALSGATPVGISVRVADSYGNAATVASPTTTVDNVRPNPADFHPAPSFLWRAETGASLATAWTSSAAGDTNRAEVRVKVAGAEQVLGYTPAAGQHFQSLPLADPLASWINVSLLPVDTAGNLAPESLRRFVAFPQNATVEYGGSAAAPKLVAGKGIRSVYLNVTTSSPTITVPVEQNPLVYGELVRQGPTGFVYWKNNTAGSNIATDTNGHYSSAPQRNTGAANPTVFQPLAGSGAFVLSNLSDLPNQARNFYDGQYQLWLNVSSPQGHRTQINHSFDIDSRLPDVKAHRNYTNPSLGPGPNMTQLHGMDGNPFRVVYNVTDQRTESGTLLDSGLRNITVELFDPATGQVVKRTRDQSFARVEIDPQTGTITPAGALSYAYDFRNPPTPGCSAPNPPVAGTTIAFWENACVWHNITRSGLPQQNWTSTFFNKTQFSGWINLTMEDLPPGKYAVRVLAYDKAGLVDSKVYMANGDYRVAPGARVLSPAITAEGRLDVVALASQRLATPPAHLAQKCVNGATTPASTTGVRDTCPADRVRIYVSATNGANDVGTLYEERAIAPGSTQQVNEAGWTNSYVPYAQFSGKSGGQLAWGTNRITYFEYTSNAPPRLADVAPTLNLNQNVFVRVVAVSLDAAGNEIITSASDWVRASSALEPNLVIRQPAACAVPCLDLDWPAFITGSQIPFNVSFDRKVDAAPRLMYWVNGTSGTVLYNHTNATPLRSGNADPRFVYNWSGLLRGSGNIVTDGTTPLPPGEYSFVALIVDGTERLAEQTRRFMVVGATVTNNPATTKPHMTFHAVQAGPGLVQTNGGTRNVASDSFEVAFTVNHSFQDLTAPEQVEIKLLRSIPRGGKALLAPGEEGFEVVLRPQTALDASETSTRFVAAITMPSGGVNGDLFQLGVTVRTDRYPYAVGNITGFLDFVYDKMPPAGTLLVLDSQETVADFTTNSGSQARKNIPSPAPAFKGFAEDLGAGVKRIEVRLVDLTTNQTVIITSGESLLESGLDVPTGWMAGTACSGVVRVCQRSGSTTLWDWSVPLVNRGTGSPDLWVANEPTSGAYRFNLSHTYRVDVRTTDHLNQVSGVNSTTFTFDPFAPDIAYASFLGGASQGLPSGIEVTPAGRTQVNWRGEGSLGATLTVKVSDNHCLQEVRLWGRSDVRPDLNVSAPMRPVSHSGRVCPNGATTTWSLALVEAPHMAEDVGNYTYWFSATDMSGRTSIVPANYRTLRLEVLDSSPAIVRSAFAEPSTGQAGGRSIIRADVFDNLGVERVTVAFHDVADPLVVFGRGNMSREQTTDAGVGTWRLDTTEDIPGLTLEIRDYLVNVTAYDRNWNRSVNPTCGSLKICPPTTFIYRVRDDGAPSVILDSPAPNATVNATPTIRLLAQHKALENASIVVRVSTEDGGENLTAVPPANLTFVERLATNGSRQGWTVEWTPDAPLADNSTLTVNASATVAGLVAAHTWTFRVDAAAPSVTATLNGTRELANRTYATAATRVVLEANDTVTATPTIHYRVGSGAPQTYTGPITPSGQEGNWTLEYWASDAAGNLAPRQTLSLLLDTSGPRITVAKHGDEILLTVADNVSGLNESSVTVHYRYGEQTAYTTLVATKVTGNSFGATLPGRAVETGLRYYFTAEDLLGNVGSEFSAAQPYAISRENATPSNLPPTIRITQPAQGVTVRGGVDLRWLAEDPEGARLTISIALRDPAPGRVLSAGGENSGSFRVNLSGLNPGAYTIVVTASDGENSVSDTVTFNLESSDTIRPGPELPPETVAPNTPVPITASISAGEKPVGQVNYRVLRDGQTVGSGRLTPTQGVYAASFTPSEPGRYAVLVDVVYTDGTTEPAKQVAAFTVQGTLPPPEVVRGAFPASLMVLAAIAVLTIALAGYGAFGRWKK